MSDSHDGQQDKSVADKKGSIVMPTIGPFLSLVHTAKHEVKMIIEDYLASILSTSDLPRVCRAC